MALTWLCLFAIADPTHRAKNQKRTKRQELHWLKKETILMHSYIILRELSLLQAVSSSLKLCICIRHIWFHRFSSLCFRPWWLLRNEGTRKVGCFPNYYVDLY